MKHNSHEFIQNVQEIASEFGRDISETKISKESLPSATIKLFIDKVRIEIGIAGIHCRVIDHNSESIKTFEKTTITGKMKLCHILKIC